MEPVGRSYVGDVHSLEELEYNVMELLWHVLNHHFWNVVGDGGFVSRKKAESFVENGGVKFAYDHVFRRGKGAWNCVYPRERAVRVNIGVGREGAGFYFFHYSYNLCGVNRYESRVGFPECR